MKKNLTIYKTVFFPDNSILFCSINLTTVCQIYAYNNKIWWGGKNYLIAHTLKEQFFLFLLQITVSFKHVYRTFFSRNNN